MADANVDLLAGLALAALAYLAWNAWRKDVPPIRPPLERAVDVHG